MTDERVIVTGCSGFVGRNVVRMLLERGVHVIGISRMNPDIDGLEFVECDLTDERSLRTDAYREATIINTAAVTHGDNIQAYEQTNYRAVLRLLSLNPNGKFIHISSSSIYDLGKPSQNIAESEFSASDYKFYNHYSLYKAKAEEELLSGKVERFVHPVSLRPHAIYGEDDTTLMPALKSRVRNGTLYLPGGGQAAHALTHISNLLHAIECSLSYTAPQPEAFNVTDAEATTIAYAVKSCLGQHIKVKSVPPKLLLNRLGAKLVPEYEVRQLASDRTYDLTKAKTLLGYHPTGFNENWP